MTHPRTSTASLGPCGGDPTDLSSVCVEVPSSLLGAMNNAAFAVIRENPLTSSREEADVAPNSGVVPFASSDPFNQTDPTGDSFVPPLLLFAFANKFQVVPPTDSTATAICQGILTAAHDRLEIICTHNVAGATAAHIHNAPLGENGPIVFPLSLTQDTVSGTWTSTDAQNPLTADLVEKLLAGDLYVNVHSSAFPGGEIRGQLEVHDG